MADYADLDDDQWAELVNLQQAAWRAEQELAGWCAEHTGPTLSWPQELHDELTRLRADLAEANSALGQHPALDRARQAGCRHQTLLEARRRAREAAGG